jgi:hypothetical protein
MRERSLRAESAVENVTAIAAMIVQDRYITVLGERAEIWRKGNPLRQITD